MATKYAQVSGDWSGNIWYDAESGGNQVPPPAEGDNAVINAGVEVSLDNESGVIVVGDDTGTALDVKGTLRRTSTATSSLTLRFKGHFYVRDGGKVEIGTTTNPISKDYPVVIELNYSSSMGDEKYSWIVESGGEVVLQGEPYTISTTLSADVASGATEIYVNDLTGWRVGDDIVLEESEDSSWVYSTYKADSTTISAIDSGNKKITLSNATSYSHRQDWYVFNLSCAITVQSYQEGYRCKFILYEGSSADIDYVRFNYFGDDSYFWQTIDGRSVYTRYGGISIRDVNCHLDNIVCYKGEYTFISCLVEGHSFTNWYLFNAEGYLKKRNCSLTNLFLIAIGYPGAGFYCSGVIGTSLTNVRHNGSAGGSFEPPQYLTNFKGYYNCKNSWSGERTTCGCWAEGQEFYLSNVEMKYNQHGIQVGYGTRVFVDNVLIEETSKPITVRAGGRIIGGNVAELDVYFSNYYYPFSGVVISSNGKNKVPYGYYGNSLSWAVLGKDGNGNCLVIDPTSPDNYMYLFGEKTGDVSFTSFPVNSGKTIILSFWVKVSTSGFDGDLQIAAEGCGINYSWTSVDLTGADSDWVQRSFTLGTTTDKGFVRLKIRAKDGATVSGDIYLDDFAITES